MTSQTKHIKNQKEKDIESISANMFGPGHKHPWHFGTWATTKSWQDKIQQLEYDYELYGADSPEFKKKLEHFFYLMLNRNPFYNGQ